MATTYTTHAAARAAYLANAVYEEERSVVKARTFISACRSLLELAPTSASTGESQASFDAGRYKDEMERARQFVRRNSDNETDQGGRRVTRADFRFLRG